MTHGNNYIDYYYFDTLHNLHNVTDANLLKESVNSITDTVSEVVGI